jgi:hypothetical protein
MYHYRIGVFLMTLDYVILYSLIVVEKTRWKGLEIIKDKKKPRWVQDSVSGKTSHTRPDLVTKGKEAQLVLQRVEEMVSQESAS